ncbi:hypothetical protein [Achromobacter sp.]|uniref:hypothetical protein n=1 Tax=Achromobacter sp. TaxID=134375 RepID=UPI003D03BDAE
MAAPVPERAPPQARACAHRRCDGGADVAPDDCDAPAQPCNTHNQSLCAAAARAGPRIPSLADWKMPAHTGMYLIVINRPFFFGYTFFIQCNMAFLHKPR